MKCARIMLIIGILSAAGTLFAASDTDCSNLKADVSVQTGKPGTWFGLAVLSLGQEEIVGDVLVIQDLRSIVVEPDGSFSGRETAYFYSAAGNFTVLAEYRVEPTETPGKLQYHGVGNIVEGDKLFAAMFGRMRIRGPIYADPDGGATAELKANGSLCRLEK